MHTQPDGLLSGRHAGPVDIVTSKSFSKNQQKTLWKIDMKTWKSQSRKEQALLCLDAKSFFVTNLKLCWSCTFLAWSECDKQFYKDAKNSSSKKCKNNNRTRNY